MLFYELVLCEKHAKQGKPYNANIFGAVQNEELVMHSSRPSFPKNKKKKNTININLLKFIILLSGIPIYTYYRLEL